MATTGSVSKGVFAFKGKKKVNHTDFHLGGGQPDKHNKIRSTICSDLWDNMNENVQELQGELNSQIFEDLIEYIKKSQPDFVPCKGSTNAKDVLLEVPTAALITGVNSPDHDVLFMNLYSLLHDRVSPHLALLKSKDCPNLKAMMAKLLGQLMENADVVEEDADDDQINTKRISCTMDVLAKWYQETSQKCSSPKKRKISGDICSRPRQKYYPVVIILEDFEGFGPSILQDFITICSNYLTDLPLVLVFGIATAMMAVHRLIPHTVSSLLSMEKFQAPPSTHYLSQVLQKILFTADVPFKLGHKVFTLLLDLFLYHDFSVVNFIRGWQFAMAEHFSNNPCSILCHSVEDGVETLLKLPHEELEHLRRNKSFRRFVENCEPEEQISLLEDDKFTKKKIAEWLEILYSYHESFYPVLHCLHALTGHLPKYPLGKQIREMYTTCLSCEIWTTSEYEEAFSLLRTLSRDELINVLIKCKDYLSNESTPDDLKSITESVQQYIDKLQNIEDLAKLSEPMDVEGNVNTADNGELPKKTDFYTLRQKLLEDKKTKKLTVFEVLRNEIIDTFHTAVKKYLRPPHSFPMYEVYYYNNVGELRQRMNASSRAVIQHALSNPHQYIQNEGCQCSDEGIPPTLLDICIVYKLHQECGRLINLYDWLQAFIAIARAANSSRRNQQKLDSTLQARFIRAVSDLQLLGFIKPTKRKTDHVARLTW